MQVERHDGSPNQAQVRIRSSIAGRGRRVSRRQSSDSSLLGLDEAVRLAAYKSRSSRKISFGRPRSVHRTPSCRNGGDMSVAHLTNETNTPVTSSELIPLPIE